MLLKPRDGGIRIREKLDGPLGFVVPHEGVGAHLVAEIAHHDGIRGEDLAPGVAGSVIAGLIGKGRAVADGHHEQCLAAFARRTDGVEPLVHRIGTGDKSIFEMGMHDVIVDEGEHTRGQFHRGHELRKGVRI